MRANHDSPRAAVAIRALMCVALGVQWCVLGPAHSTAQPLEHLVRIGRHLDPARPMLLWGLLFLTTGTAGLAGCVLRDRAVAGWASLGAAAVLAFYGLANGIASTRTMALVDGRPAHTGTGTVLIVMVAAAVACAAAAIRLLRVPRSVPWTA